MTPLATGPAVYRYRRAFTPRQEVEHRAHVRFCRCWSSRLTPWERDFLDGVAGLHGNLSIRQGDVLTGLAARIDHALHDGREG